MLGFDVVNWDAIQINALIQFLAKLNDKDFVSIMSGKKALKMSIDKNSEMVHFDYER